MPDTVAKLLPGFEALRSELADLGPDWVEHPDSEFFCTADWFDNLVQHGFEAGALSSNIQLLFSVNSKLGCAVCLPLLSGARLTSLANYYSSLYGPIQWERLGANHPADHIAGFHQEATQLFATLIRTQLPRLVELQLSPMDLDTRFAAGLASSLRSTGFWTDRFLCFGNWYLPVGQRSFDQYRTSLPSTLQHSIDRGQRRLSKHGDWSIQVHTQTDAKLEAATADFIAVYRQSWKPPEPRETFIPSLIHLAAQKQWLRLGILRMQGQPVAAQLWIVKGTKASIFKLAYVQGFERFSPGSVLTARLMRHVLDLDKVTEVDYLTGDDPYKKDWMSHRRERWGLLAFQASSARAWARASRHFLGKALRSWRRHAPTEP